MRPIESAPLPPFPPPSFPFPAAITLASPVVPSELAVRVLQDPGPRSLIYALLTGGSSSQGIIIPYHHSA
jgi:hypothetical protein